MLIAHTRRLTFSPPLPGDEKVNGEKSQAEPAAASLMESDDFSWVQFMANLAGLAIQESGNFCQVLANQSQFASVFCLVVTEYAPAKNRRPSKPP